MIKTYRIIPLAFILFLFGFTLITVAPVFAQGQWDASMGMRHPDQPCMKSNMWGVDSRSSAQIESDPHDTNHPKSQEARADKFAALETQLSAANTKIDFLQADREALGEYSCRQRSCRTPPTGKHTVECEDPSMSWRGGDAQTGVHAVWNSREVTRESWWSSALSKLDRKHLIDKPN